MGMEPSSSPTPVTPDKDKGPGDEAIFSGRLLPVFLRYSIPSAIGLVAITTASLVDGIFVGRFIGSDALASVNLLIPVLTFWFATILMVAIGGSVKAGSHLGQHNLAAASRTFSQNLLLAMGLGLAFLAAGLTLDDWIFRLLGAPPHLVVYLKPYLTILLLGLPLHFAAIVFYYFLRTSGQPSRASIGLIVGALSNIALDMVLIGYFKLGIAGAAAATVTSQIVQFTLLGWFFYRFSPLRFSARHLQLPEFRQSLTNGFSEFINEISTGLMIATVNWLVLLHMGVSGVAAFAVVNYLQFTSLMLCYGFVDSLHVLVSQNHGAGNNQRARHFYLTAIGCVVGLGVATLTVIFTSYPAIVRIFLPDAPAAQVDLSLTLIYLVWPVFLLNGFNITTCAYLTATGQALASAFLTALRSLVLPVGLLLIFGLLLDRRDFLMALPIAEMLTFLAVVLFLIRYSRMTRS